MKVVYVPKSLLCNAPNTNFEKFRFSINRMSISGDVKFSYFIKPKKSVKFDQKLGRSDVKKLQKTSFHVFLCLSMFGPNFNVLHLFGGLSLKASGVVPVVKRRHKLENRQKPHIFKKIDFREF